jgi:hypothetical protein
MRKHAVPAKGKDVRTETGMYASQHINKSRGHEMLNVTRVRNGATGGETKHKQIDISRQNIIY